MKVDAKFFFIVIIATVLFIMAVAIVLLKANSESSTPKYDNEYEADVVMKHLYFDGQYLDKNVSLNLYNEKGICKKRNISIESVMKGNKCIALFFSNCCTECVKLEIILLEKLSCRNNIIFIVDHELTEYFKKNNFIRSDFYEINSGKLCSVIDDKSEFPLLFYTDGLRIMTSCVVNTSTHIYTRKFHEFINLKLSGCL